MKRIALLLFLFVLAPFARSELRVWTNLDGRTVIAELIAMDETMVTIRNSDGKVFAIQRSTLSEKDRAFLKSATVPLAREGKIAFDEEGKTLSQVTRDRAVLSGACDLEGATVTISGTMSGTAKVTKGRWEIPIAAALDTWAKGAVTFTATAEVAGSKASATMSLNFLSLLEEGAKGDGITDDTVAINAAAKEAASTNAILVVPPGRTFTHASTIVLDGVEMLGCGPTSVLLATDPMKSAVTMRGTQPRLRNLTAESRCGDIKRQSTPPTCGVWVDGASNFWVDAVIVKGAAGAGIFNSRGHGFPERHARISRCTVTDTLADAIHQTGSAHHVIVEGNVARNNGDDCFAVVSYNQQLCHDIIIVRNKGSDGHARGASVVGGKDILVEDNDITNKTAAGIIVVSEEAWKTNLVERVTIRNNRITGCPATVEAHGGIFIGGRKDFHVTDVLIEGNQIKDSPAPGIHLGYGASKITIRTNKISGSKADGIFVRAAQDTVIENNDIESSGSNGIHVGSDALGECLIVANRINTVNLKDKPEHAMIRLDKNSNLQKVEITDNRFKAGRSDVRQEVICLIERAVVKRNK